MLPYLMYAILMWHWHPVKEKIVFSAYGSECSFDMQHGYWIDSWNNNHGDHVGWTVQPHENCELSTNDGVNYTVDCQMQPGWENPYLRSDGKAFIPRSDPDNYHEYDPRDYMDFPHCKDVPAGAVCVKDMK